MNRLVRAATEVQALLESKGIGFCFIGGFAAQRHAEPRVTRCRRVRAHRAGQ
jgi:hypothetical protein